MIEPADSHKPRAETASAASAGRPWIAAEDRRVGILGGTFDPVHYGHLVIAEQTREALGLDRVYFVPAAQPPHKLGLSISSAADRAAMVALAIADNPAFALSRIELDRSGPSYTVDTLVALTKEASRQGVDRELFFVLSSEVVDDFPTWHAAERILDLCRLAVVPRPGAPMPSRADLEVRFGRRADRIVFVETLPLAHSASHIRRREAAGQSIRYLVPPAVEAYIHDHRLYRSNKPTEELTK